MLGEFVLFALEGEAVAGLVECLSDLLGLGTFALFGLVDVDLLGLVNVFVASRCFARLLIDFDGLCALRSGAGIDWEWSSSVVAGHTLEVSMDPRGDLCEPVYPALRLCLGFLDAICHC